MSYSWHYWRAYRETPSRKGAIVSDRNGEQVKTVLHDTVPNQKEEATGQRKDPLVEK